MFWERYGGKTYEGLPPKMAIFAASVAEATDVVRPAVEKILSELNVSLDTILVNTGDTTVTKNDDIRDFNNLDVLGTEGSRKQFIILVEKGREGWNCRSLLGIALFRSPKSKIFVLQATMRCLRKLTDEQLKATVFLSKENLDTLDEELRNNYNMEIKDLGQSSDKKKNSYKVRVLPPPRSIKMKRIWHEYSLIEKEYSEPIDFKVSEIDDAKYESKMYEKGSIRLELSTKETVIDDIKDQMRYSRFSLVGEISRYMNLSCVLISRILSEATPASERTAEANNFIGKIEPTIWRTNKLTGMVDFKNILLTSRVVNNEGNEILRSILETGKADEDAKDNYSKNYRHFQELFDKHSTENPLMVYQFIYALLNQAILLPITADTQDTALTIFSTLNDRGLPLSDADIFKAKIYNQLAPDDKKVFIDRWKDLDEQSTDANESIQQLFYYNMFYYRARDKDTKTTTPGVRKYYAVNKFERLYKPELLDTLFVILNLWKVVNKGEELEDEAWSKNIKIRQTLDILTSYPNEYWKYPVVIYYVCYRNEENFETRFARFLNKLLMELMTKYLMIPTINAVKPDILKLNSAIVASDIPTFEFKTVDMTQLEPYIQNPNRNAVRMLLKTLAYEHQDDLLPAKWEIEHIFPQKWQTNYFPEEPDATIKEKIEHIGNKLPFEKKLNIVAGNGYFGKKKKEYTASEIVITKAMGTSDVMDWNLESITKRDIRVSDEVVKIMNRWNNEYLNISISEGKMGEPSEEELAQIEKFKKNGWI